MSKDDDIQLTEDQKKEILKYWNTNEKPVLKDLCKQLFGADGRGKQGRIVKEFLVSCNLKVDSAYNKYYKNPLQLTDEQKEYVRNHCGSMPILELAKELFNNDKLWPNNLEVKVIEDYIKTIPNAPVYKPAAKTEPSGVAYSPPKTLIHTCARVNKYRYGDEISQERLKTDSQIQLCLNTLIRYCHIPRFILLMSNFVNEVDRELFESQFLRYTYDKPDLTEEELDAYINLCLDIVNFTTMQREREGLIGLRDTSLEEKGGRVSLALVNAIKDLDNAMNENQKRQERVRENLNGKRSDRLNLKLKENESPLKWINAWKSEKKREKLLKRAEERKKIVKNELQRIETLDTFIAELFGVDTDSFGE